MKHIVQEAHICWPILGCTKIMGLTLWFITTRDKHHHPILETRSNFSVTKSFLIFSTTSDAILALLQEKHDL